MRAIADSKEVIVEFSAEKARYRLILQTGTNRFSLDKLTKDDNRPWILRWELHAQGIYQGYEVVKGVTTANNPISPALTSWITSALRYASEGPVTGKGVLQ